MAADLLGAMRVEIVGDNSKLDKSIDQSNKKTDDYGKTVSTLGKTMKGVFSGIAIAFVVKGIAKVTKELINAASDAEETRNKFNVVFGSVADDAKEAADRIKDEFKLSDATTEKFLSQVGDITSGLGATGSEALLAAEKITALGLDIDSFANLTGGAEQAVSALTSLFTGEREAAKALGIVINDNNLKAFAEDTGLVFKELTPLEKGFLSLELATKQSQLAIGDFARSQDSFANQSKIAQEAVKDLKVEIGEALLPTATTIIGTFGRLTGALAEFIDEKNRLEEAREAVELGTADIDQRVIALAAENEQLELSVVRRKNNLIAIQEQGVVSKADLEITKEQIALVENQIEINNRVIAAITRREKTVSAIAQQERADAERRVADLMTQEEAEALLADRILSRRTSTEVQIDLLDQEIERWKEFEDILGVNELLNDLIAERNELLKESSDEALEDEIERTEEINEIRDQLAERRIEAHEAELIAIGEANEEAAAAEIALAEEVAQRKQDLAFQYSEAAISFLSALDSFASATASSELQRLKASGASEEELDKKKKEIARDEAKRKKGLGLLNVGIDTASAIIGMLVDPGGIPGIALSIFAGITGGIQAAAIAATPLPSFAIGGIVPGTPSRIDNTVANVASGELIANQDQKDRMLMEFLNGGGGGGNTTINAVIDKKVLFSIMLDGSRTGQLTLKERSIVS